MSLFSESEDIGSKKNSFAVVKFFNVIGLYI